MSRDGKIYDSSLKPSLKFMEEKAPMHRRGISDVLDIKPGEDIKECIFTSPLLQKLGIMGQETCIADSWKVQVPRVEMCGADQQKIVGKPAEDLIQEIASLEAQVMQLEQHLLSLYRKKFDQQVLPLYKNDKELQTTSARFLSEDVGRKIRRRDNQLTYPCYFPDRQWREVSNGNELWPTSAKICVERERQDKLSLSCRHAGQRISPFLTKDLEKEFSSARFPSERCNEGISTRKDDKLESPDGSLQILVHSDNKGTEKWGEQKILDSSINRTHSSLSHHFAAKHSTIQRVVAEAEKSDHSMPLYLIKAQDATTGEADHAKHCEFTDSITQVDNVPETPNWLSEEMVKCISMMYCALADPPLSNHDRDSSFSLLSAMDQFSPKNDAEMWNNQTLGSHLENSFVNEKLRFSGTYCSMIEVAHICKDKEKLRDVDPMLQRFRALVLRLATVDPGKLKHRLKLAFWTNVHNALVMHAFLVYGIPENNLRRMSLVLKASYNIGGKTLNVEMIQRSLLGCRLPRPGQWLQSFLFPKTKFKVNDPRRLFAIDHTEPLLHFALCTGSHSDPAVRVYTPTRVYQELEAAKDDYIQLALQVQKKKILLPKILELFSKDCDLSAPGFVELLEPFLPTSLRNSIKQKDRAKIWKSIQWIPHNFSYRYLFSKELVS